MRRAVLVVMPLAAACGVPEAKYNAAVKDAETARADARNEAKKCDDAKSSLGADIQRLKEELAVAQSKMTSDEDRAALEELKKAHDEAKAREEVLRQFVDRFKHMVDAGTLKIVERHGRLVLQLQNDVLFDPLKTDIKPEGMKALEQIAQALRTMPNRKFQVAGHTDVVFIKTKEYASNWELSSARAIAVVKLLVAKGVNPASLSAAAYSLYDPLGRDPARNRRIEITLVPNVQGLLKNAEPPK